VDRISVTIPVHDHQLVGLEVDAVGRTLRLRTVSRANASERVDVGFEGVEAYVLRGDALGSILFEIEPEDALDLYRENASEMQRAHAATGGHAPWTRGEASATEFLAAKGIRGWRISSSIGMEGVVWAREVRLKADTTSD
jgi:hypothetical protein